MTQEQTAAVARPTLDVLPKVDLALPRQPKAPKGEKLVKLPKPKAEKAPRSLKLPRQSRGSEVVPEPAVELPPTAELPQQLEPPQGFPPPVLEAPQSRPAPAPPQAPRPPAKAPRDSKRALAAVLAGLVVVGGGAYYYSSSTGGGDDTAVPVRPHPVAGKALSKADLSGVIATPAGYAPARPGAAGNLKGYFCSELIALTNSPAPGAAVASYARAGASTASVQSLRVFPTTAAANAFARAALAGVPCSSSSKRAGGSFTPRPVPGSVAFKGSLVTRPLNEVIDVVAVRNVVYLSADASVGKPADAAGHDKRVAAVKALLRRR